MNTGGWNFFSLKKLFKQMAKVVFFLLLFPSLLLADASLPKPNFSIWNVIDYLSHEKGYIYVKSLSNSLQEYLRYLPRSQNNLVEELKTSSVFIHYLQAPENEWKAIYEKKIREKFNNLSYIISWQLTDKNKNPLMVKGTVMPKNLWNETKNVINKKGFAAPIYSGNELLGYVVGTWNIFLFPEIYSLNISGNGVQSFFLNANGQILDKPFLISSLAESLKEYISVDDVWNGPLIGLKNKLRFYSFEIDGNHILFVYPSASWLFYFFRFAVYALGFLLLLLFVPFLKETYLRHANSKFEKESISSNETEWNDKTLKEAVRLNQESIRLHEERMHLLMQEKELEKKERKQQKQDFANLQNSIEQLGENFTKTQVGWNLVFKKLFASWQDTSDRLLSKNQYQLAENYYNEVGNKESQENDESLDNKTYEEENNFNPKEFDNNNFSELEFEEEQTQSKNSFDLKVNPINQPEYSEESKTILLPASMLAVNDKEGS